MPRYMITPDRDQSGEGFGACWDFDSPFTVIADGDGPMEAVLSAESKDYCPWADDGLDPNVDGGQELDGRLELAEDWSDWGHEFGLVPMIRFGQLGPTSMLCGSHDRRCEAFDDLWDFTNVITVHMPRPRPTPKGVPRPTERLRTDS